MNTPWTDAHAFNEEGKRPTGEPGEILSVPAEDCRKLELMLADLMAVIDSHEIDLVDCDRRGHLHCDCLHRQMRKIKESLSTP